MAYAGVKKCKVCPPPQTNGYYCKHGKWLQSMRAKKVSQRNKLKK